MSITVSAEHHEIRPNVMMQLPRSRASSQEFLGRIPEHPIHNPKANGR